MNKHGVLLTLEEIARIAEDLPRAAVLTLEWDDAPVGDVERIAAQDGSVLHSFPDDDGRACEQVELDCGRLRVRVTYRSLGRVGAATKR